MAWYPTAIRKKITAKNRDRMTWYRRVNLHVAVSEASSLFGYFNQKGIADSHFYVRKDGTIEQMVDTAYQAYADLQGNDATISIETQGGLHNTQTEKWTPAQIESLARIYAWAVKTHGIPVKMAKDSIPTGTSSHGLSWHRLGIDGNFPGDILHGRVPGGMHYSTSRGKVCPGNAKIRQVPDVFARAQQILNGTPAGGTTPPTTKKDWFDMASKKDLEDAVWAVLNREVAVAGDAKERHGKTAPLYALIRDGAYGYSQARSAPSRTWATRGLDYVNDSPTTKNHQVAKAHEYSRLAAIRSGEALSKVAALQATVHELAKGQGVDADKIDAAINKAVQDALADLTITLSATTED